MVEKQCTFENVGYDVRKANYTKQTREFKAKYTEETQWIGD